eukprot:1939603-Pleurochrysis_carterae.AAC.1
MPPLPAALETSRPKGGRSEGAWIFWYGAPSLRTLRREGATSIEEGLEGVSAVPVSFGTDRAEAPTESPSHELRLQEQAQSLLAGIEAIYLHTSSAVALDREALLGGGGSSVPPRTFKRGLDGGQKSRSRAFFSILSSSVGLGEAERRGLGRTRMHFGVWAARRAELSPPFCRELPIPLCTPFLAKIRQPVCNFRADSK